MKNKRLTCLLIVDVVIAFIAMVFVLLAMWNRPLGPSLAQSSANTQSSTGNSVSTPEAVNGLIPQATPTSASLLSQIAAILSPKSAAGQTICGGPAVMNVLLIGSDERRQDYLYGLADSIRLVRLDFATPSVTMLDFPRDLWVEIPDIADHYGITHAKLNQAYFFGNPGMGYYDGPDQGPGLMAKTLELNFGAQVDHYLAMDMQTFVRLVDTIDGIDVHLNTTVDMNEPGNTNPDMIYPAGDYHLDGAQALALARDRNPTIFQRARYQTMVLEAVEKKLLKPAMIPNWPQIIADFGKSVQTDLSPNVISQLLCLAKSLSGDQINTVAFPDDMFASDHTYDPYRQVNTYTLAADFDQMRKMVTDFMNGTWP